MNEPSPPSGTPSSTIVLCEKHGLRYNAAIHDGCARCRKEAGQLLTGAVAAPVATAARPAAGRVGPTPVGPTPLGPPLVVAMLLVVVSSLGMFGLHTAVHRRIVAAWGPLLGIGGEGSDPAGAPSGAEYGGGDPYATDDGDDDRE